jgi:hypothetical protein
VIGQRVDNISRTDFIAYHGTLSDAKYNQLPVINAVPQASGHMRIASREIFAVPVNVSFMAVPVESTGTLANDSGLHFRFEIDNEWGYTIHLVRKDGRTKVAREAGWLQYDDVEYGEGVEFKLGRPYMCRVVIAHEPERLIRIDYQVQTTEDAYAASVVVPRVANNAPTRKGLFRPVWSFGRVGFRFDNLRVLFTPPAVL